MNKLFILFIPLFSLSCSLTDIRHSNNLLTDDKEYILQKLNRDFNCLSYYWQNCKKGNISVGFYLNDNGKLIKTEILNKESICPEISENIKSFYKDSINNFNGLQVKHKCTFKYDYNFTECAKAGCLPYGVFNDVVPWTKPMKNNKK